jgi:hypothetical protein
MSNFGRKNKEISPSPPPGSQSPGKKSAMARFAASNGLSVSVPGKIRAIPTSNETEQIKSSNYLHFIYFLLD